MSLRPDNRPGPFGAVPPRPVRRPGIPDLPPGRRPVQRPAAGPVDSSIASLLAGYPRPQSDAQLGQTAQGMIDPLIAALTDRINQRATAGAGAIRGYTGQLAKDLAGFGDSARNIYAGAQASQAASDSALADRLAGGGGELAAGLADRLKGIGNGSDPAVAQIAQQAAATGQGSSGALYGKGSASLADLISRGAGAQEYASKLPGIAGLAGAQQIGQLEQQAQNDIATQAGDVRAKLPELIASLRGANDTKASNLAGATTDVFKYQTGRQDTANQNAANRRERAVLAKMANETNAAKAEQDWNKFIIGEQDRQDRAAAAEQGRNTRASTAEAGRTARATAAAQARAAAAAAKAKTGGLSAGALAGLQQKAASDADTFYYGVQPKQHAVQSTDPSTGRVTVRWIDTPGTGTPGLDYGDAVKRLMSKYPSLGRQGAMQILNNYYAPGERGRPVPASQSHDPAVNPNAAGPPAP